MNEDRGGMGGGGGIGLEVGGGGVSGGGVSGGKDIGSHCIRRKFPQVNKGSSQMKIGEEIIA